MTNTVEQVKERLSIEEVVSWYVKLKPAGQNLKGLCPFHGEKTPSFVVSPARNTYHCFGCGVGGDIFSFIEGIEGLDFKGALKLLADKAGVELVYTKQTKEDKDEKETLFSIMELARDFYVEQLNANKSVKEYLHNRAFTDESITKFNIGFAGESWDALYKMLTAKGYTKESIEKTGMIIHNTEKNSYYDRFRSRIMFPISDSVGRVVAFSGRIFGAENEKTAKYINSPETVMYNKSKILYGYDKARQSIRKNDFAILVEGQMDLLASHQAGFSNTVAISGTALTQEHITLLSRMTKNIVLALDADDAGLKSAARSAYLALAAGFDVKVVRLPDGSDPADIIKDDGVDKWRELVRGAKHIIEFLINVLRDRVEDERKFKLTVEKKVVPYLKVIKSSVDRQYFISHIASRLAVSEDVIEESMHNAQLPDTASYVSSDSLKNEYNVNDEGSNLSVLERLVGICIWQADLKDKILDNKKLEKEIEDIIGTVSFEAVKSDLSKREELPFIFEQAYSDKEKLEKDVQNFLLRLKELALQEELNRTTMEMRKAEAEGNSKKAEEAMNKCNDLHRRIAELKE